MSTIIEVTTAKGGVGATTVACALAVASAEAGYSTLLVDRHLSADAYAVLGLSAPTKVSHAIDAVNENLSIQHEPYIVLGNFDGYDFVIIDSGLKDTCGHAFPNVRTVSVVRNAYLSLRADVNKREHRDHVVLVYTDGEALTVRDVESVVGQSVITWPLSTDVSRANDAGLFRNRTHLYGWADQVITTERARANA